MYTFHTKQFLNATLNDVWQFISSPKNLEVITPDYMSFEIKNKEHLDRMYEGQIIVYSVKPMLNIPLKWVTEITHVKEPFYFVDEQRFGPYKFWHHKHFLHENSNGIVMEDLVHYDIAMGPIGKIMNKIMIRKQLKNIFRFRTEKMAELFGSTEKNGCNKILSEYKN